jgi:hypothetical protein
MCEGVAVCGASHVWQGWQARLWPKVPQPVSRDRQLAPSAVQCSCTVLQPRVPQPCSTVLSLSPGSTLDRSGKKSFSGRHTMYCTPSNPVPLCPPVMPMITLLSTYTG